MTIVDSHTGRLIGDDRVVSERAARSAIGLRDLGAQQTGLSGFGPHLAVEASRFFPPVVVWSALLLVKALTSALEHAEFVIHPRGFW